MAGFFPCNYLLDGIKGASRNFFSSCTPARSGFPRSSPCRALCHLAVQPVMIWLFQSIYCNRCSPTPYRSEVVANLLVLAGFLFPVADAPIQAGYAPAARLFFGPLDAGRTAHHRHGACFAAGS